MAGPLRIDLNADVGEGFGVWTSSDDSQLFPHLSSANIACGFHAGDPRIMRATCAAARQHGVGVGAHVAYPDRVGFGRRALAIAPDELQADVLYQLGALHACAEAEGTSLRHVKPHGALYTACVVDDAQAEAVAAAIVAFNRMLLVLTPPGSKLADAATIHGLTVVREGFVDRRYDDDLMLVSRHDPAALLDGREAVAQALSLVTERHVTTRSGRRLPLTVDSLCVHSDTPGAAAVLANVATALQDAQVAIRPCS